MSDNLAHQIQFIEMHRCGIWQEMLAEEPLTAPTVTATNTQFTDVAKERNLPMAMAARKLSGNQQLIMRYLSKLKLIAANILLLSLLSKMQREGTQKFIAVPDKNLFRLIIFRPLWELRSTFFLSLLQTASRLVWDGLGQVNIWVDERNIQQMSASTKISSFYTEIWQVDQFKTYFTNYSVSQTHCL